MDLGFETIGNALLICHDRGPVLATDTWLQGPAYFGSWMLSHEIPAEQRANVLACKYVWISHGHPDHLSLESLELQRDKEILLPDHFGGRIARDLRQLGFRVRVLQDGVWTPLTERLRVCSLGDVTQDAALLVDLGGHLIVNSNDCADHGASAFVRQTASGFKNSFLMCLTGYGDADMINFFDEQGRRIPPPAMKKEALGPGIAGIMHWLGLRWFVPFSSMHQYQRADSVWANECITPIDVHHLGFESKTAQLLPAFVRYDLARERYDSIAPRANPVVPRAPEEFGDNWSDELQPGDREKLAAYFQRSSHLRKFLGWVNFRVGGKDNTIDIAREHRRGITFETPRNSLMSSIDWEIFDDLLIGNYMRTILHGDWHAQGTAALYPDFEPFLCRFGDNGRAFSEAELRRYFQEYKRRGFFFPGASGEPSARAIEPYLR